jgi:hypothetical protein
MLSCLQLLEGGRPSYGGAEATAAGGGTLTPYTRTLEDFMGAFTGVAGACDVTFGGLRHETLL